MSQPHSLQELNFERFQQITQTYNLNEPSQYKGYNALQTNQVTSETETLQNYDNTTIVENSSIDNQIGERLGYDRNSGTYFVELWDKQKIVKIWKRSNHEWGEIQEFTGDQQIIEQWNIFNEEIQYEINNKVIGTEDCNGYKIGRKQGILWKEKWIKQEGQDQYDKEWEGELKRWGESKRVENGIDMLIEWEYTDKHEEVKYKYVSGEEQWGNTEGKEGELTWTEKWKSLPNYNFSDKYWSNSNKKWGLKQEYKDNTKFIEEWEEQNGIHRIRRVWDDNQGNETQVYQGYGDNYSFSDELIKKPGLLQEKKQGKSDQGEWYSERYEWNEGHTVLHKGSDQNGEWEENWRYENGVKTAEKKGKSVIDGTWDEYWYEDGGNKSARKHGVNSTNEWWEEWKEWDNRKWCKKVQNFPDKQCIQEWEEERLGVQLHTWGKFLEGGIVVKEWNDTYDTE